MDTRIKVEQASDRCMRCQWRLGMHHPQTGKCPLRRATYVAPVHLQALPKKVRKAVPV